MKNKLHFDFRKLCFALALILAQCMYAQNKTITGTVTDSKQEPLIGVNAMLKGNSTVGTITDIDGNYTLSVPSDKAVLVYSYIGYTSQEVTVGQQSTINILLKEDAQALDEVVVVGYGVVKKRDLVGSIASVKSQDITAVPTSNVLESMQGKLQVWI